MADEIRKIANLRTEASAPDLPGRVQNEEFVFDEMIGAELVQEVCRHKDIRSVEKLFSLADPHYDFRRRRFAESSFNSDGGERRQSFHHHRAVSKGCISMGNGFAVLCA